ncbi:MAG TPA: glycosyltransferase, partial [Flavipsychrobacter sp.]|nr:glycosyltransferase [Flavipsychrobacter sp.]
KALETDADLYICHIDCSLYVGKKLIQRGKKVAFDLEDWYSHDYLVASRPVEMLKRLEKFALKHGAYVTCPSYAMADAIYEEYGIGKPDVIYNGFPQEKLLHQAMHVQPSLVWFSQTIGPGRGLEKMIAVLQKIQTPLSLNLIGDVSDRYRLELETLFERCRQHKLVISPQVKHNELHGLLSRHIVGLALEETFPPSRDTTITNKILQYLQAGLRVFATGTKGQCEVAADFRNAVCVVSPDDLDEWTTELQKLVSEKEIDREEIVARFNEKYSWEAQEIKLLELVGGALR